MIRLLFLSKYGICRSQIAQGFARRLAPKDVEITSGGLEFKSDKVDPQAIQVMREKNIDISGQVVRTLSLTELAGADLVIALGAIETPGDSPLPGCPVILHWDIPEHEAGTGELSLEELRRIRDEIQRRVEVISTGGYLPALTCTKHNTEMILDHLSDGIIAHDAKRYITWFNKAAEQITGYDRREVVGRDCYDIFPGGFCGSRCPFREGPADFDKVYYPLKITTRDGKVKRLEFSSIAMRNSQGLFQGVLASFRDVTEVTQLRRKLKAARSFHGIIGSDDKMQALYELISDLAASDCTVLIQGASGTGKELVAGAIHEESRRAGAPFVTVNCGALPEGILESELFGHVRGAFTGAIRDKKGRFELAHGGTIFLDEVAELSPNIQVKLLRVLQTGQVDPVGGEKPVKVDVRIISATNKDLRVMVKKGQFREDLFYRLCVVPVDLPPLRERRNDIPLLIDHFLQRYAREMNQPVKSLDEQALRNMLDYPWPGNIRELQNALQYALVKCKLPTIAAEHLPPELLSYVGQNPIIRTRRGKLNASRVETALEEAHGNKSEAAKILGVGRATLHRFLKKHPPGSN